MSTVEQSEADAVLTTLTNAGLHFQFRSLNPFHLIGGRIVREQGFVVFYEGGGFMLYREHGENGEGFRACVNEPGQPLEQEHFGTITAAGVWILERLEAYQRTTYSVKRNGVDCTPGPIAEGADFRWDQAEGEPAFYSWSADGDTVLISKYLGGVLEERNTYTLLRTSPNTPIIWSQRVTERFYS